VDISLQKNEQNWLVANLPSPNVREGWRVNSLMLRFRTRDSVFGEIDKIGIRDGDVVIHEFAPLVLRAYNSFSTVYNVLPGPRSFKLGLGVSIHVVANLDSKVDPPQPPPTTSIEVVSIGVEFVK
jgi:hypothetical protein